MLSQCRAYQIVYLPSQCKCRDRIAYRSYRKVSSSHRHDTAYKLVSQFKCQLKQPPVAVAAVLRVMLLHIIYCSRRQWKSSCQLNFVRHQQYCYKKWICMCLDICTYSKLRHACDVCYELNYFEFFCNVPTC